MGISVMQINLWRSICQQGQRASEHSLHPRRQSENSAVAIPVSNLGNMDYEIPPSKYMTISDEPGRAGNKILASTNFTDAATQVDCLRAIRASGLSQIFPVASYLVMNGRYLVSDGLELKGPKLPV
ncbi:hypothetical protein O1611_g6151 [Lasiodiplodia mahajangana]|uniref:Uncharacterized protein n=1 Tax=Lasiodiplodia mahajangana TaxID=1108764 RepID=A0ACC2JJD3_9PEZI|nr:hypothetical protein O1611_g6151 [Lasiodiplodia mahajangana]